MRRLLICALAIVASCYRPRVEGACEVQCTAAAPACPAGLDCGADGLCYDDIECSAIDASVDGTLPDEAIIDEDCVQTHLLATVCPTTFLPSLTAPPTTSIDTSSSICTEVLSLPDGEVCLIAAETIIVNTATVRVTGTRPLALFGRTAIVINTEGNVDLQLGGAGMRLDCNTPAGRTQIMFDEAAGGGAGGTMVQSGGNGGIPTGFPGVLAPIAMPITTLRGGCPGGAGGNTSNNTGGGTAGLGGGALQLMSPQNVVVSGKINAYGGGGGGGTAAGQAAGGGGGGSGGLVAIDANKVVINGNAMLRAHGGAGGGGAAATGTGGRGGDGVATNGTAATGGAGMGGANNGSGGAGSSNSSSVGGNGGNTGNVAAGAGGGGGAAGLILLRSTEPIDVNASAMIHPLYTTTP